MRVLFGVRGLSLIFTGSKVYLLRVGLSVLPLYFLAEGIRVSLVSISSSSEIFSTVVRYSITRVSRSGRREISKICSMYDKLSKKKKKKVISSQVHVYASQLHQTCHQIDGLVFSGSKNKRRQTLLFREINQPGRLMD